MCAFGLLTLLLGLWIFSSERPSPYFRDATLVPTKTQDPADLFVLPGVPAVLKPLARFYYRLRPLPRGTWSFPAGTNTRCSIHGLLTECHEVSGTQFFIDQNVAAGNVMFGSSNVLNGPQWVFAFTNALQHGVVEWWDPKLRAFRKENPVLIAAGGNAILVVPQDRVADYAPKR